MSGLLVQLLASASARARPAGAEAAASTGGDVVCRGARPRGRFTAARALLVDCSGRNLLRPWLWDATLALAVLDVLVLARALAAFLHTTPRHLGTSVVVVCGFFVVVATRV